MAIEKFHGTLKNQDWYKEYLELNSYCNSEKLDEAFEMVLDEAKDLESLFIRLNYYITKFEDTDKDVELTAPCNEVNDVFQNIIKEAIIVNQLKENVPEEIIFLSINLFITYYLQHEKFPKELLPFCLFYLLINNTRKLINLCKNWLKRMEAKEDLYQAFLEAYNESQRKVIEDFVSNIDITYDKKYSFSRKDFFVRKIIPKTKASDYIYIFEMIQTFFSEYNLFISRVDTKVKLCADKEATNISTISRIILAAIYSNEQWITNPYNKQKIAFCNVLSSYYHTYITETILDAIDDINLDDVLSEYVDKFISYLNNLNPNQTTNLIYRYIKDNNAVISELLSSAIKPDEKHRRYFNSLNQYIAKALQYHLFINLSSISDININKIVVNKNDVKNYISNPFDVIQRKIKILSKDSPDQIYRKICIFHQECLETKSQKVFEQYENDLLQTYINDYF